MLLLPKNVAILLHVEYIFPHFPPLINRSNQFAEKQIATGIQLLLYTQTHQWGKTTVPIPVPLVTLGVCHIPFHTLSWLYFFLLGAYVSIAGRNTAEYFLSWNKARHASSFS